MTGHEQRSSGSRARTRTVAAVVVAAVVLALVAGTLVLRSGGGSTAADVPDPSPTLTLARTSTGGVAAVLAGAGGSTTGGGYRLRGTLSTSTSTGVVIDPSGSTASRAQVRTLLDALGMGAATPRRVDGGWTATAVVKGQRAAFALDERGGNVWQYERGAQAACLAVRPGADPSTATSCGVSVAPGTRPDTAPSRARLLAIASGVFQAVGVTPGRGLAVHDAGGIAHLDVPLTVEGLPVVGVDLSVAADADGLTSALGWLDPTFSPVGTYPLVSARAAYDLLAAQPVPEPAIACAPGSKCPVAKPQVVTAARLAWLTSREGDRTVLVPAWQFEVDGFYDPAVVAVEPRYLATPTPTAGSGGGSGTSGGSTGSGSSAPGASAAPGSP